ncbi:sugar ABC transporter substrate-binding protein [Pseudomonas asuensis]|uniref:Sugar ABC transporter substrate-binding protein n=1 Tax=Pseudomonas asuensis TaxID=1825787 RepID=A0ABQ2GZQ6_9PSED|nr:sugar ABC transporter substrate-binding protein [Pseudomonas asuensis]
MKIFRKALIVMSCLYGTAAAHAETLTIAAVNNHDLVRMQQLSKVFEEQHSDIKLEWVLLEENTLRQRLTTDIATQGAQFDVVSIGAYEASLWGARGWLTPIENLPADYDVQDLFPSVREGLSVNQTLYALPFYAESSITYYRKDLVEQAGLQMPEHPTWEELAQLAAKLHQPDKGQYGICLRGKAGWGENMGIITTMANSFGARWFNEGWQPEFTGPEWTKAINFYVDTMKKYGPPGVSSNGFNENLALFSTGKCAIWVDASVAGSSVTDSTQSSVVNSVGFAASPKQVTTKGSSWLWAWSLAIPASSQHKQAALDFITWASSKQYIQLVAEKDGVAKVPPGTRKSTYNEAYLKAAPFAKVTLAMMEQADPAHPTLKPVPYRGIQYVLIPEFQSLGTQVGTLFSGALTGQMSAQQALQAAQNVANREMKRAGYPK